MSIKHTRTASFRHKGFNVAFGLVYSSSLPSDGYVYVAAADTVLPPYIAT